MPCNQVRSIGVDLTRANYELLTNALEELEYKVTPSSNSAEEGGLFFTRRALPEKGVSAITGRAAPGKFSLLGMVVMPQETEAVKRNYAVQCIEAVCQRYHWKLKEDKQGRYFASKQSTDGTDKIQIEVVKDGGIKVTTDPISAPNHTNAEGLLRLMATLAGGESAISRRRDRPQESGERVRNRQ